MVLGITNYTEKRILENFFLSVSLVLNKTEQWHNEG
jgi:hypothetical protein